jgi:hypothetical protein
MKYLYPALIILFSFNVCIGQDDLSLNYYFPGSSFDPDVPTPESVFGFQVGKWHLSHDQIIRYAEIK